MKRRAILQLIAGASFLSAVSAVAGETVIACGPAREGIWTNATELQDLPTSGLAWKHMTAAADMLGIAPNLADQNEQTNVCVLAGALIYARTGWDTYRKKVIESCVGAIGTERGGETLAFGRKLVAYVVAADLVKLPPDEGRRFRQWLARAMDEPLAGRTLRSTHERRPNNWGTHAGASRASVAVYLNDKADLERTARVFKGYLGDCEAYRDFHFGDDLSWQANPLRPVGVNPKGAVKSGRSLDGVLPDDQRRSGPFRWPPPKENYAYEALQGALVQAVILHRAGYDVWNWEDKALLRAFEWLRSEADFPAEGDDTWLVHIINRYYGTRFPTPIPARPGKNMGWTDWLYGQP